MIHVRLGAYCNVMNWAQHKTVKILTIKLLCCFVLSSAAILVRCTKEHSQLAWCIEGSRRTRCRDNRLRE